MTIKIPAGYIGIDSPEVFTENYIQYLWFRELRKIYRQGAYVRFGKTPYVNNLTLDEEGLKLYEEFGKEHKCFI